LAPNPELVPPPKQAFAPLIARATELAGKTVAAVSFPVSPALVVPLARLLRAQRQELVQRPAHP